MKRASLAASGVIAVLGYSAATDQTLKLVNVGQQTLYFSDWPVCIAGHLTMAVYLDERV